MWLVTHRCSSSVATGRLLLSTRWCSGSTMVVSALLQRCAIAHLDSSQPSDCVRLGFARQLYCFVASCAAHPAFDVKAAQWGLRRLNRNVASIVRSQLNRMHAVTGFGTGAATESMPADKTSTERFFRLNSGRQGHAHTWWCWLCTLQWCGRPATPWSSW